MSSNFLQTQERSFLARGGDNGALSGSEQLLGVIARLHHEMGQGSSNAKAHEREDLLSMLEDAHFCLARAEDTILRQEKRIADLEALSSTDTLTNILNRRGFFENFERELARVKRGLNEGGLLVMIDLDNFKTINDTYGHSAGDACLKLVAKSLEHQTRPTDFIGRLGGDEFIILLPQVKKTDALKRAQELSIRLNNLSLIWRGHEIAVQASIGLKSFGRNDTIETIIEDADRTLYADKSARKQGRKEQG